ncbi:MAG: FAD-dependent monooxygenase [Alphaproteobacteria bacterium]|nr:FAD-dependent monooxygenase [Alphaproteobacteria bacterium]
MRDLPRETDVFVIGGGPAGLAAALAARRAGLGVVVADRSHPPIDKACGEGLMPDGIVALRRLGLDTKGLPGLPFRGIRFIDGDRMAAARFLHGHGLGIRRPDLHQCLVDSARARGVVMAWRTVVAGIEPTGVRLDDRTIRCRWIIGADGVQSRVRQWAGLDRVWNGARRVGLRRRYRVAPWTDFVEVHWGQECQAYVTPVAPDEVCVTIVGSLHGRFLADGPARFPALARRLADAPAVSPARGAITVSSKLPAVASGRVALIGDASGSVDAVTGEGLALAFQQAEALGAALAADNLAPYSARHRRLAWRPRLMAHGMLFIGAREKLRGWTIEKLARHPRLFESLLAMHVGGPASAPLTLADA